MDQLLTVREYAKSKNISTKRVYDLIKKHRLKVQKIKNIMHVVIQSNNDVKQKIKNEQRLKTEQQVFQDKQQILLQKIKIDNELKKERLLNIKEDTQLKRLKNTVVQQKLRTEYAQEVLQVFITSFASLKSYITSLHLTSEQLAKFKQKIEQCTSLFEHNLTLYLYAKDKEQNEETKEE